VVQAAPEPPARPAAGATWADQLMARPWGSPAVVAAGGVWTTADLLRAAAGAARAMDEAGLPPGVPVPALLWSSPEALALVVAGALGGRPVAPLGPLLTPSELAACLDGLGAEALVVQPTTRPRGEEVAALTGHRLVDLADADASAERAAPTLVGPWHADDVAVVLHTSGTSGAPTRVELRQRHLAARTPVVASLLELGPGDRYVTAKPIHHIGGLGLTLAALGAGAAVLPFPRFTPAAWRALAELRPTHASVVPSMVEVLLPAGELALPGLRLLQYGGAPIHPDTLATVVERHPELDLVALYGQTEGSPLAALSPAEHRRAVGGDRRLLTSAGRAAPGVELVIEDEDADGVGEVAARAAHVIRPDDDGWLRTGDLGRIDADGYLHLVGRRGDVINRGGENVHPREVEEVLAAHPGVVEVAVAAVEDRRLGQAVGAWVVRHGGPGAPPSDDELRQWARARLAGFKVPEVWHGVEALPRNAAGKVVRRQLPRAGEAVAEGR